VPLRTEKMERRREAKAETAARLDKSIESELLKRLQAGTYGDIYNFPLKQYEKVRAGCEGWRRDVTGPACAAVHARTHVVDQDFE
jgi:hypothetical protein